MLAKQEWATHAPPHPGWPRCQILHETRRFHQATRPRKGFHLRSFKFQQECGFRCWWFHLLGCFCMGFVAMNCHDVCTPKATWDFRRSRSFAATGRNEKGPLRRSLADDKWFVVGKSYVDFNLDSCKGEKNHENKHLQMMWKRRLVIWVPCLMVFMYLLAGLTHRNLDPYLQQSSAAGPGSFLEGGESAWVAIFCLRLWSRDDSRSQSNHPGDLQWARAIKHWKV